MEIVNAGGRGNVRTADDFAEQVVPAALVAQTTNV